MVGMDICQLKNMARVGFAQRSEVLILFRMTAAKTRFFSGRPQRSPDTSQDEVLYVFSVDHDQGLMSPLLEQ